MQALLKQPHTKQNLILAHNILHGYTKFIVDLELIESIEAAVFASKNESKVTSLWISIFSEIISKSVSSIDIDLKLLDDLSCFGDDEVIIGSIISFAEILFACVDMSTRVSKLPIGFIDHCLTLVGNACSDNIFCRFISFVTLFITDSLSDLLQHVCDIVSKSVFGTTKLFIIFLTKIVCCDLMPIEDFMYLIPFKEFYFNKIEKDSFFFLLSAIVEHYDKPVGFISFEFINRCMNMAFRDNIINIDFPHISLVCLLTLCVDKGIYDDVRDDDKARLLDYLNELFCLNDYRLHSSNIKLYLVLIRRSIVIDGESISLNSVSCIASLIKEYDDKETVYNAVEVIAFIIRSSKNDINFLFEDDELYDTISELDACSFSFDFMQKADELRSDDDDD